MKYKKSIRIVVTTLLVYGVLVATNKGEFWPFSIYPMFSQAGKPWKRAVVRDVTGLPVSKLWKTVSGDQLAGKAVPLGSLNVNTNDIANYLSKTDVWTDRKVQGVRKLVQRHLHSKQLLILQARGSLAKDDSVEVRFIPYIYFSADTTILNKQLKTQ